METRNMRTILSLRQHRIDPFPRNERGDLLMRREERLWVDSQEMTIDDAGLDELERSLKVLFIALAHRHL